MKTSLAPRLLSWWGPWYNDYIHYRYGVAARPPAQR